MPDALPKEPTSLHKHDEGCRRRKVRRMTVMEPAEAAHRIFELEAERDRLAAENADMRAWGDNMQSEASRLAEWGRIELGNMSYDTQCAVRAVEGLVARWTAMRRGGDRS